VKTWRAFGPERVARYRHLDQLRFTGQMTDDEREEYRLLSIAVTQKRARLEYEIAATRRRLRAQKHLAQLLGVPVKPTPAAAHPDKRAAAPSGDGAPQFAPSPALSEHYR